MNFQVHEHVDLGDNDECMGFGVSLGDYDNILLYRKVAYKGDTVPASLADLDKMCNLWAAYPELAELAKQQPANGVSKFLKGDAGPEFAKKKGNHQFSNANPEPPMDTSLKS